MAGCISDKHVITWSIQNASLILLFSELGDNETIVQLPLGCQVKNDSKTGRTTMLSIPLSSIMYAPLVPTFQFDNEIGALSFFLIDEQLTRLQKVSSVPSDDLRFIFDTIDGKIVHLDIPDIATTLLLEE